MEFESNCEIDEIPRFEESVPVRLSAIYPWLTLGVNQLFVLSAAGIFVFFQYELVREYFSYAIYAGSTWILISLVVFWQCKVLAYVLREHDISFYQGLIFRKVVIQPFSRLQHIEVARGPFERLFGLATLKLYSAGGAMHSLAIPGLSPERADDLRGYILKSKGLANEQ